VAEALSAVEALDGVALRAVLTRKTLQSDAVGFVDELVAPLMTEVGERWHAGDLAVSHEHLASVVVREVLGSLLEKYGTVALGPTVLVATPEQERHELGALMAAVVAADEGWRVLYLGPALPLANIVGAAERRAVQCVALSVIGERAADVLLEEPDLVAGLVRSGTPVLAGGSGALRVRAELEAVGVVVIERFGDFRAALRVLAEGPGGSDAWDAGEAASGGGTG
jgi:methylmalonyl-CoA mutase cobalamin-binding subunit